MKKLMVTLLCAAFGGAQVLFAEASQVQLTSGSYAGRKNLVMQFDAIDNVGTGTHDATATVWKDLVSANAGAYDMTLTNKSTWSDTALVANGGGAGASGAVPTGLTIQTMEGCYTLDSVNSGSNFAVYSSGIHDNVPNTSGKLQDKLIWHVVLLSGYRGVIFGGNYKSFVTGGDYLGTHTMCWIREGHSGFQDGTKLPYGDFSAGYAYDSEHIKRGDSQTAGAMGSGDELKCPVKMHAVRFYDRKLTAEEIALNSNLDHVRFEGTDPATLTWPAGYRGREGYGLECVVSASNNVLRGSIEVDGEDFGESYEAWTVMGAERTVAIHAKAKPGYRFVRWEDRWDALTDDQRVSPSITVTGRTDRALILTAVYTLDLSAHAYQQRGLAMQFDGIDNVGTGTHDSAAAVWKDIVTANDGAYDMTLTTNGSWKANALYANGKGVGAMGEVPTGLSPRTMEVSFDGSTAWSGIIYSSGIHAYVKNKDTGKNADKMLWHVAPFSGSVVFGGNCNAFAVGPDHSGLQTLCWIRDAPAGFQNGINLTMQGISDGYNYFEPRGAKQTVGAMGTDSVSPSSFPGAVKMYEIRLYDCELSAAEIAFNSNVDKIRFAGADPETLTWPEGCCYQDGVGLEYILKVSTDANAHGWFTVNGEDGGEFYEEWFIVDADEVTITAVPEPGYRFVGWEGEGLTDAERRQMTISGVNRVQLDIKPVFAFGSSDLYLTKGLAMQFDAIDNVGTGTHDLTAAKWKDLVSANAGAYDMTVTANGSWNDTALVTDGLGSGATNEKSPPADVQAMEGCYTFDSPQPSVSGVIYSSGLDDGTKMTYQITLLDTERGLIFGGNVPMFAIGNDYSGTHSVCWMREGQKAYYDGIQLEGKGKHDGFNLVSGRLGRQSVGALVDEVKNRIPVKMHAIRFYDRKLTADEVAFNANVDQVRFNEVDPATLTWPAEISYNAEQERLEVVVTVSYNENTGRIFVNGAEVRSDVATAVPYGNGLGVVEFVPTLKGCWLDRLLIDGADPIVAQDQKATVRLFDVRAFKAKIRGGGLILIVQ